ncbi:MAG TPA: tetratricopeptide repeat protein, partial [bacterium]
VQEIREKNLIELLSENNLIRLGSYFEKAADFREAVQFYMTFINTYPNHPIRPKALHRVAIILRTRLNDETAAEKVLTHLQKLYPSYTSPNQLVGA